MEPSIGVAVGSVVGAFCYGIGNSSLFSSSSVPLQFLFSCREQDLQGFLWVNINS